MILDDKWVSTFMSEYSRLILLAPYILGGLLKVMAIVHPGVPTNKIADIFKPTKITDLCKEAGMVEKKVEDQT